VAKDLGFNVLVSNEDDVCSLRGGRRRKTFLAHFVFLICQRIGDGYGWGGGRMKG